MEFKHELLIKKLQGYVTPSKFGLCCSINRPVGEYPLHRHDYIEIEYIVSGKMEHEVNGIKSTLSRGDCYCVFPGDLHRLRVLEPIVIHNICIDYLHTLMPIRQILNGVSSPLNGSIRESELKQLMFWFEELKLLLNSDTPYAEEKTNAYTLLITSCIFENCTTSQQKPIRNYQNMSKAMDYIAQHYSEDIRLSDVATALDVSVGHMSKLFTKVNHISFSDYLTIFRIEEAQHALRETDLSITEIAFSCGFNSFPTFSRSFKKLCGCTPSQYRYNENARKATK